MDSNLIPLYLAAGPNLTLHCERDQSNVWFRHVLVDESVFPKHMDSQGESPKWHRDGRHQSRIGVLVRVPRPARKDGEEGKTPRITELLFYASTTALGVAGKSLTFPTPSSAENEHATKAATQNQAANQSKRSVIWQALPLSSDMLYSPSLYSSVPLAPGEARFLPRSSSADGQQTASKRHSNLTNLFDEASDRRKKTRHKGGQSISLVASRSGGPPLNPSLRAFDGQAVKREESQDCPGTVGLDEDPATTRAIQRTTAQLISPKQSFVDGEGKVRPPLGPGTTQEALFRDDSIEARNKQIISRTVMAGMRMNGLEQRNRVSLRQKTSDHKVETQQEDRVRELGGQQDGDEFKSVYHHTYKATVFALVSISSYAEVVGMPLLT